MSSTLRVWLVDDDASIRWVLERALKSGGMTPRVFEAAEPALEALRGDAPDVLLTDIRMPGLSGLDLVRRLHETRPQLPIIVMTAHGSVNKAVEAMRAGAHEFLVKPFDENRLLSAIANVTTAAAGRTRAPSQNQSASQRAEAAAKSAVEGFIGTSDKLARVQQKIPGATLKGTQQILAFAIDADRWCVSVDSLQTYFSDI